MLLEYKPQITAPSIFCEQALPRVAIAAKETLINIQPKVNVFDILLKAYQILMVLFAYECNEWANYRVS